MQINYKDGGISSIKVNIKCSDLKTEKGKDRFLNLMRYFTEYFISELEFNQAETLVDYASNNNIDISNAFLVPHTKGTALCNISQFCNKVTVRPFISLDCSNFLSGWTFEKGNFSDVTVYTDGQYSDNVFIVARNTLYEQDLFLHWLMNNMEKEFYTNKIYKTYQKEDSVFDKKTIGYSFYESYEVFNTLVPIVEEIVNINRNIRIDRLVVNGKTIVDYIKEHKIYQYAHSQTELFHMCFFFGKPYKQVKKYVNNHSIKFDIEKL